MGLNKTVLRAKINKLLLQMSVKDKTKGDSDIIKKLLSRPEIIPSHTICTYVSYGGEVDTKKLIEQLLVIGKAVVVPKIKDNNLKLHRIFSLDDLERGHFGIPEPGSNCPVVDKQSVDLFIVPGIAFDRQGHRLGRGDGYYDKLLAGVTVPKIGLAYACQVIAEVPHTSYDVPMTALVTEKEAITC